MPFSEFEQKRCEKLAARFAQARSSTMQPRHRPLLAFRVGDLSVELFEVWPSNGEAARERPVAKAKFNRSRGIWKIFWMRSNGRWTAYEPMPEVPHFEDFLDIVGEDEHACFFA